MAFKTPLIGLSLLASLAAACGGEKRNSNPVTAPTPVVTTPPPATTPPVVSTPAPTTYSGRWSGRYVIERCDGIGSVQDIFCSANRGAFPVGTSLPISLDLTQSGSSVSGTIALGQITGVVSGAVRTTGLLTLSGIARSGPATATLTYWDTRAAGNSMDGFFSFNATYSNIPGVADVSVRLSGVSK